MIPRGIETVTPKTFKPVTKLTGISQQIRYEVYDFVAAVNTFHIDAGVFRDYTLKPLSTATEFRSMNSRMSASFKLLLPKLESAFRMYWERMIRNLKDEIKSKEVPSQLRFWKICVSTFNTHGILRLVADINFKESKVSVRTLGAVHRSQRSFEKAFVNAMQKFAKEAGYDGVTIQDVSRFLEQVTLPKPKRFWKAKEMFEELKDAGDYVQDEDASSILAE